MNVMEKVGPMRDLILLWLNVAPCYQYDISPVDHITQRLMAQHTVTLRNISARLHTQSHV